MQSEQQGQRERMNCLSSGRNMSLWAPGIQYLAVDSRGTVRELALGRADVAGQRPMEQDTTMMLYSMTKTFTAAAALQLVETGRVGLAEPVRSYLPWVPYGEELTVRHLLSQTSGIPNPLPLTWVHRASEHAGFDENAALTAVLERYDRLHARPGDRYGYSNISYWLLGKVIEGAARVPFGTYLRNNIFDRLGAPPAEIDVVIPSRERHAKGYIPTRSFLNLFRSVLFDAKFLGGREGSWLRIEDHYPNGPAFGGIVASARAVSLFLQDQLRARSVLFAGETRRLLYEQQKNNAGKPVPMTLAWHIGAARGRRFFYKEGGGGGFHGEMRIYPEAGIATVALGNSAAFRAGRFLAVMDRELLA